MRKISFLIALFIIFGSILFYQVPFVQAQTDAEKKFMKQHQKEMETFMNKCSGCHSLQRIFAQKRSKEEWDKILKQMAGKPHAMVSEEEMKHVRKWIDLMGSAFAVGP